MAGKKYIRLNAGRIQELAATDVSAGAGNASDIVALDAAGRIDNSMMPVGIGADTASIVASEALAAGDFVNIHDVAGASRVRKADATVSGKEAMGFVLAAVASAATATVYFEGQNNQVTGKVAGARQFLGTTPGLSVAVAPSAAGNVLQLLGFAVSATSISAEIEDGIILA